MLAWYVVVVEGGLIANLRQAGLSDIPERFSVAPVHQAIPRSVIAEIERFIRVFDEVTTREAWQDAATAVAPEIARSKRPERCFFSAWDFHVPPDRPDAWQLIELNDNGSGLLIAALLNRYAYELSGIDRRMPVEAPAEYASFAERLTGMMRAEAASFFGEPLRGVVLILDDAESLERGRFRQELALLRDVCRAVGWPTQIAAPSDTTWDGERLLCRSEDVRFIINRSTDFWWEGQAFSSLRAAYANRSVYVAPNPFTYATRSDKRLLEWLSTPARDAELAIRREERELLGAHVPQTRLLREENVDELARARDDLVFKPCHGFGGHGLFDGMQIGRTRLRRLLKQGHSYVAQRKAPRRCVDTDDGVKLWTDLRVWAYRGERFLVSGRASRRPMGLDLSPPGGWLPTYALTA